MNRNLLLDYSSKLLSQLHDRGTISVPVVKDDFLGFIGVTGIHWS